jgi:hypothetical protein
MLRIGIAIGSLLIGLSGCRKPVDRLPDAARARGKAGGEATEKTGSFTLSLSTGGGFAGAYQGYTLLSTGEITAWTGRAAGPRTDRWTRKADPDTLAAFAMALDGYLGMESTQTGNMTTRIGYASSRGDHQWSIAGAGAAADAPEPFRTWYPRVEAYCRSLAPEP